LCVKPEGYNWPNEANIDHVLPVSKVVCTSGLMSNCFAGVAT
jgi:hypothetical protein